LANVACQRGDLAGAGEALCVAEETFAELGHAEGLARLHAVRGAVEARRGQFAEALLHYQEALAMVRTGVRQPRLEMEIRLDLCRLYLDWGRLPDAED